MNDTVKQSFKSLSRDGTLRKTDLYKVRIQDLTVEQGFNLRIVGPELNEHIAGLLKFILDGGQVPPLEVRVADNGDVIVVDGHCRLAAFKLAVQQGAEIDYIDVLPFRGNDVDRVARIITSASGKQLTLLEIGLGYKRLAAWNLSPEQIAQKFNKTRQHVDQALILANANADVHALVSSGAVAASAAIDVVRKHGEAAGEILAGVVNKVKAGGKSKATAGDVHGKALPKKIVSELSDASGNLISSLTPEARTFIETLELHENQVSPNGAVNARVLRELLFIVEAVKETQAKQATRGREKVAKESQQPLIAEGAE